MSTTRKLDFARIVAARREMAALRGAGRPTRPISVAAAMAAARQRTGDRRGVPFDFARAVRALAGAGSEPRTRRGR